MSTKFRFKAVWHSIHNICHSAITSWEYGKFRPIQRQKRGDANESTYHIHFWFPETCITQMIQDHIQTLAVLHRKHPSYTYVNSLRLMSILIENHDVCLIEHATLEKPLGQSSIESIGLLVSFRKHLIRWKPCKYWNISLPNLPPSVVLRRADPN